jgi:hypothetical protein
MFKTITNNMFNAVAALTIVAAVCYLAAITHIMPLPENASRRLSEISIGIMDILFAGGSWVIRLLVD